VIFPIEKRFTECSAFFASVTLRLSLIINNFRDSENLCSSKSGIKKPFLPF
jgi:hypothetical protein